MKMHKNCCHQSLLAQICTKSFVGWGFAPDPTGGAYGAPPDPLAGLGMGPRGKGRREGREKEWGRGGKRKEGEGVPEFPNPELASLLMIDWFVGKTQRVSHFASSAASITWCNCCNRATWSLELADFTCE